MVPIQLPRLPNWHLSQTTEVWWPRGGLALPWPSSLYCPIMGQYYDNESPGHAMMHLSRVTSLTIFPCIYLLTYSPLLDWWVWSRPTWTTRTSTLSGACYEDKNHTWASSRCALFLQHDTTLYILEVHENTSIFSEILSYFPANIQKTRNTLKKSSLLILNLIVRIRYHTKLFSTLLNLEARGTKYLARYGLSILQNFV